MTPEVAAGHHPSHRFVFLHGFTQTHHHWHSGARHIADAIGGSPTTSFVDLPGHGLAAADRSDISAAAQRLPTVAGRGTYVGYSMGGRFALVAAASAVAAGSTEIERLILIGATPGLDDEQAREERVIADEARAGRLEEIGVESFVDEWLEMPMFAGLPDDPAGRARRCDNTVDGLAHSLRTCGTGHQPSLWSSIGGVTTPTLVLAGALDLKFSDIGRRMTDLMPNATFATVDGAGHAAHTERPAHVARLVADWCRSMA